MSLINTQLLAQAQQERFELFHKIAMGDNSQRSQELLKHYNNKIQKLNKAVQAAEEEWKAKHPEPLPEPVKETPKERDPLPEDKLILCKDCGDDFNFSGKDQVFFSRKHFPQPVRCSVCREAHKPQPITLTCRTCSEEFEFTVKQQHNFKRNNWPEPKTCPPCCQERKKTNA